jgi:hypothetical protein
VGGGVSKSVKRKSKTNRVEPPRDGLKRKRDPLPPVIKVGGARYFDRVGMALEHKEEGDSVDAYVASCNQLVQAVLAWAIATERLSNLLRRR